MSKLAYDSPASDSRESFAHCMETNDIWFKLYFQSWIYLMEEVQ